MTPVFIGFGLQVALFTILRFRLFIPVAPAGTGAIIGTSGVTSTAAMLACCIHHVTDVLPILGLSAAASFLAQYQRPFILLSLGMTSVGILIMLGILFREHRKVLIIQRTA